MCDDLSSFVRYIVILISKIYLPISAEPLDTWEHSMTSHDSSSADVVSLQLLSSSVVVEVVVVGGVAKEF